jgi:predicted  nucleic acid-binding Zn-ribbon protein
MAEAADPLSRQPRANSPALLLRQTKRERPMNILVPVPVGEWIDKLTILEIKLDHIDDPAKLANVRRELEALAAAAPATLPRPEDLATLREELKAVNEKLWRIEDDIREHERAQRFDRGFVELARAVYVTNDRRAALKREINLLSGSLLVEEKSYAAY